MKLLAVGLLCVVVGWLARALWRAIVAAWRRR